ncbi:MAG TPA: carboxypeptidase regulatory-like domain-containing protein [Methylomirabilota bacterium]|nr:carboxypeptidase regulatory-like domain-containing protein [Methylomirabilota bacterium]
MNSLAPVPALPFVVGLCLAFSTYAGTIVGVVTAKGRAEAEQLGGKYDSRKFKFAEKVNYNELKDFVVYVDEAPASAPKPPEKPVQIVTQKDATFRPHVLPVLVGTTVEWPNRDEIYHNVFSISEAKEFDLGLYKSDDNAKKTVLFDKPGRVDIFCSIHKEMHCIVLALETPYFAATDARNRYVITNVPAGVYKLKAWHERVPSQVKQVTVPADGEVRVDFTLGFANKQ